jgi:hypothetical protein
MRYLAALTTIGPSYPPYINLSEVDGPTHDHAGLELAQPVPKHVRITVRGEVTYNDKGLPVFHEAHIDLPVDCVRDLLRQTLEALIPTTRA